MPLLYKYLKALQLALLLFFAFSCTSHKKPEVVLKAATKEIRDTIINHMDTITNIPVGQGFYMNEQGALFERKQTAYGDDTSGLWISYVFLDSTMVTDDWERPVSLRNNLDPYTYSEFSDTWYSRDKNRVYYYHQMSDGGTRYLVKNADVSSFVPLAWRWAKDNSKVYYQNSVVKGADVSSFRVLGENSDTAKDRKHTYVSGERID